ncbi:DUF1492 domain-containing protein [Tepidanaerobacter sp. EBM-49]|uniref:DUF1492 domain-containing protein n=1 Tax=Tepidanaerobacter sp. EBM-49 TaxID=1918504 RepID=UPI00257E8DF5|nr:DUF1492 domain-containing protein [Tepidanaerobacter sp. EBM-49]
MKLGPDWAVRTLEHFLYNYFDELRQLQEMKNDIIDASPIQSEFVDGKTRKPGDPTAAKGVKLASNRDIIKKERWLKVVKDVLKYAEAYDKAYGTKYSMLINKKYFDELGEEQICNELNIDRSTFYAWKKEILSMGINLAAAMGLVRYEDFLKKSKTYNSKIG